MEIGAKFKTTLKVSEKDTAVSHGSGTLTVLATPRMVALMEEASYKCIEKYLDADMSSVGTYMEVKHLSATPVGMEVFAESELVEVDGRRVVFLVKAYDEKGLIGEGKHERFIVSSEKFLNRTYQKLEK